VIEYERRFRDGESVYGGKRVLLCVTEEYKLPKKNVNRCSKKIFIECNIEKCMNFTV